MSRTQVAAPRFDAVAFVKLWKAEIGALWYVPPGGRSVSQLYYGIRCRMVRQFAMTLWNDMKSTSGAEAAVIAAIVAEPSTCLSAGWSVA